MDVVIKRLQKEKGDNVLFNIAVNTSGGPINWNNGILDGKIQIPTIQLQSLITGYKWTYLMLQKMLKWNKWYLNMVITNFYSVLYADWSVKCNVIMAI